MEGVTRVVLGLEEPEVAEEILHFLDRSGRARVVGTATDERQLAEAIRQLEPDAVVASPALATSVGRADSGVLLAVDTAETVSSLRGAIRAGARGFYVWPADRDQLAGAAARAVSTPAEAGTVAGRIVAVHGPRGGVGTTFIATHLAAALERRRPGCVLVDLDLACADVAHAIGIPAEETPRTLLDLVPVARELSSRQLDELVWRHENGLRIVPAPVEREDGSRIGASAARAAIKAIGRVAETVVVHVPRGMDDVTRAALATADTVLIVLRLDLLSFRAAKRAIEGAGLEGRSRIVVNAPGRGEITLRDVERVFGAPPIAVIPADRNAARAQDRGRLLPPRGRSGRAFDRLARRILAEGSA